MSEYFGVIATSESGSTAVMDLMSGRELVAKRVAALIESGHSVRVFACKEVEFEVYHTVAIDIKS